MTALAPRRYLAIDAARTLALIGMMIAHIAPLEVDGSPTWATPFAGKAAALFAILAGVSIVLSTRRRVDEERGIVGATVGLLVRGGCIALLGLILGAVSSSIAIILVNYGVMFMLATLFLRATPGLLGAVSVTWLFAAPIASHWLRAATGAEPQLQVPSILTLGDLSSFVEAVTLTGYYPVLTWMGYILLGMFLAKIPWDQTTLTVGTVIGGVTAVTAHELSQILQGPCRAVLEAYPDYARYSTAGAWGTVPATDSCWLTVTYPHSGTTFDLLYTAGIAVVIIALLLMVEQRSPDPRLWSDFTTMGAMPLTIYTAHVLLVEATGVLEVGVVGELIGHILGLWILATMWRLFAPRGPFEALVGAVSNRAATTFKPAEPAEVHNGDSVRM